MAFSGRELAEARERVSSYAQRTAECSSTTDWPPHDSGIASLLWHEEFGQGSDFDCKIQKAAECVKENIYRRQLYTVVPLYVTSICTERCLYCNFRADNHGVALQRIRLSPEQLEAEVHYLVGQKGLRVIELVYATDPLTRISRMCRDVERVSKLLDQYGGGTVGINAEALEESEYRQLVGAGLNFAVIWQETYDQRRYSDLHPGTTKKTCFDYRIEAIERMLAAGVNAIGMGVLSGLSAWREDWAMLIEHESYLRVCYGITPSILGIPRLKPAAGANIQSTQTTPTDQEFRMLVALHNLYSPSTLPFINTRENWDTCLGIAAGGGALFTLNCSTIPGGYAHGTHGYQFPTASYDAPIFAPLLEHSDLIPVFAWRFDSSSLGCINQQVAVQISA